MTCADFLAPTVFDASSGGQMWLHSRLTYREALQTLRMSCPAEL
jgi:hypothetical protein